MENVFQKHINCDKFITLFFIRLFYNNLLLKYVKIEKKEYFRES